MSTGDDRDAEPITVLIVDDEELVRTGLRAILGVQPGVRIVGEAADGVELPGLVRRTDPDVVLMDVRMPGIDGIEATHNLRRRLAEPPAVLVITTFENDDAVYAALRAGASGFLLKRARPEEVVEAVRVVARGESVLFPRALCRLAATFGGRPDERVPAVGRLTERERDVLRLMARGLSNREIADELVLGVQTVKSHVANLLGKLDARDRTGAVIVAYESGFVRPAE